MPGNTPVRPRGRSAVTTRGGAACRPSLEELGERCVPAVVSEFPLGTAPPAPQGITPGPDGALWYTDPGANKVGRISTSGAVTEYTLPTPASDPRGITAGPGGALWFAEFGTDRVGRLDPATGAITEQQLTLGAGPTGIVTGPDGALWVTEAAADKIARVFPPPPPGLGVPAVAPQEFAVPGAGSTPFGIAAGPDGNLWFTEFGSDEIGQITTAGVVTEFAVPGTGSQPLDIAAGPDGRLWFTEFGSDEVGAVTTAGAVTEFAVPTASTGATGIVAGPDGALWFTEATVSQIGRVTTAGAFTEFSVGITPGGSPTGIAAGPDGRLWFTEPNGPAIGEITTTGIATEFFLRASGGPAEATTGPDGNVWFTESGADKIARVSADGHSLVEYSLPATGSDPRGITTGPDGNLWFAEFGGDKIGRVTTAGAITEFAAGITTGAAPRDIVAGPDGALWLTEAGIDRVARITTAGAVTEFFVGITAASTPFGITAGPDGRLWFTEFSGDRVAAITTAGAVSEFNLPAAGSGPLDVAPGPDGNVWFTENTSGKVGRVTPAGVITEFTPPTANPGPTGITPGPDGSLWFTEANADRLGRITPAGTITELSAGITGAAGLAGITLGPDANLRFAESTANQIGRLALSADLSVTKTDNVTRVAAGQSVTYTITVSNPAGADPVNGARVTDAVPGLTGVAWSAVFAGGATGTGNGGGPIDQLVNLPAGGSATYTVTGTVLAAVGSVVNTAAVHSDVTDPNGLNNTATDVDTVTFIATGTGVGGGPVVRTFNPDGSARLTILAYEATFRGGVQVATGDVDGDGVLDIVTGAGVGGGPVVRVFDGQTGAMKLSFLAYEEPFRGGVNVAVGDIDGDGVAEIVTGVGNGGGPVVKVFNGRTGTPIRSFLAYEETFRGGVNVAAGDIDGDGKADIVTGTGVGGAPLVKAFSGPGGAVLRSFFAYEDVFRGGVNVAAGDIDGDGRDEILTGTGVGGGPVVKAFSGADGSTLRNFPAYEPTFRGGVNVGAEDVNGDGRAEIVTGAGVGGAPLVKLFSPDGSPRVAFFAYEDTFRGGVDIG